MYNLIYYFLQLNMRLKYNDKLEIDINTGKFYYLVDAPFTPKKLLGKEAGCKDSGYICIADGRLHKLFFEFIIGNTDLHIDHKNSQRNDNRPENLRLVTQEENSWNYHLESKSYYKTMSKNTDKFIVQSHIKFPNSVLSKNGRYCSKSMTEQECIDIVKEIKNEVERKLAGILTLRQIIDHMIDYNLLQDCTVSA